jgi:DNA-binding NtrC family response regulator
MFKLLVIDDEPNIRFSIEQVFGGRADVQVFGAHNATEGLRLAREESPHVILLDVKLGEESGLDVCDDLARIDPRFLIIFITGHGSADTAIEAMKRGACDYLVKPLDAGQLIQVVEQAFTISRLMHIPAFVDQSDRVEDNPDRIIGTGPLMQTVCKQIGRVAPQDVNVLILGESGTGKELVARAIYHHSRRTQAPFLAINCAAIPESLLESELFGHEKGAFTGADRRRIGKFEQCHHGTLFLDEVGDMAPATQAKILRLLQEGRFERLGGSETITVDVRIVTATNQNLDLLIEQGGFRRDLFYRLRGVTIRLPPLRDRAEDIPELAHHFLYRYNRQLGTTVQSIAPEAIELLQKHLWPGNIRELQSVIREALIVSAGATLLPEFLPVEFRQRTTASIESDPEVDVPAIPVPALDWPTLQSYVEAVVHSGDPDVYRRALEHFDRLLLSKVLALTNGNQAQAATLLGLSRPTLRSKLRVANMSVQKILIPNDASRDSV